MATTSRIKGQWLGNAVGDKLVRTDDHKGYINCDFTHASAEIGPALKRPFDNDLLMKAPELEATGLVGLYESLTIEEFLANTRKPKDLEGGPQ